MVLRCLEDFPKWDFINGYMGRVEHKTDGMSMWAMNEKGRLQFGNEQRESVAQKPFCAKLTPYIENLNYDSAVKFLECRHKGYASIPNE